MIIICIFFFLRINDLGTLAGDIMSARFLTTLLVRLTLKSCAHYYDCCCVEIKIISALDSYMYTKCVVPTFTILHHERTVYNIFYNNKRKVINVHENINEINDSLYIAVVDEKLFCQPPPRLGWKDSAKHNYCSVQRIGELMIGGNNTSSRFIIIFPCSRRRKSIKPKK